MTRRSYSGSALATALAAPLDSTTTTFTIVNASTLPTSNFVLTLDLGQTGEEKVLVGTRTALTCSGVTRGWDGTIAASHTAGAVVAHTLSAVDLDEANGHVNSTSNVHGITGSLAQFFAGFPQPRTKLFHQMSPPDPPRGCFDGSSGGSIAVYYTSSVFSSGGAGQYGCVGGQLFDNSSNHVLLVSSGVVDLTARMSFESLGNSSSGLFVGIGDTGLAPAATANGGFLFCDATGGSGGVTHGLKVVGSSATTTSTTAATTGAAVFHDYRITYPLAGGTATLYVDGVQVGTLTSCPALTQPYFSYGAIGSSGGAVQVVCAQASVVEI